MARPLVLLIDDLQWMRPDEVDIWRSLIEGSHPLNHVMVVSMFRVPDNNPPPLSALLSAAGVSMHIELFSEKGVAVFLAACFPVGLNECSSLASLLYAETAGSPLYLRSLIVTLVSTAQNALTPGQRESGVL